MSKVHIDPGEVWVDLDDIAIEPLLDSFSEMMIDNPVFDSMYYYNEDDHHYIEFEPKLPELGDLIKKTLHEYIKGIYGL